MVVFVGDKFRENLFVCLFFERFSVDFFVVRRFFLDFLSFLRSASQIQ